MGGIQRGANEEDFPPQGCAGAANALVSLKEEGSVRPALRDQVVEGGPRSFVCVTF